MKKDSKELTNYGKKPKLQCVICEAYFSAKCSLKLHVATVHDKQR